MSSSNSKSNSKKTKLRLKPGSKKRRDLKKRYKKEKLFSEARKNRKKEFKDYDKKKEEYANKYAGDVRSVEVLTKNDIPKTSGQAINVIKNYINTVLQKIDCLKDYSADLNKYKPVISPADVDQVTALANAIVEPVPDETTKKDIYTSERATAAIIKHPVERLYYIYNGFCDSTKQEKLIYNPDEFKRLWRNLLRSIKLFNTKYIGFHKPLIKYDVVVRAFKNHLLAVLEKSGENISDAIEELQNEQER